MRYYVSGDENQYKKAQKLWDDKKFFGRVDLHYVEENERIVGMNFYYNDERDYYNLIDIIRKI